MPTIVQTVFILDDDVSFCRALERLLRGMGYRVKAFQSAFEFFAHWNPDEAGCLLLDLRMPDLNGLEVQRRLAGLEPELPIIFVSGQADVPSCVSAMRAFLAKVVVNALPFERRFAPWESLSVCAHLLQKPGNILIFYPEGTRAQSSEPGEFKPGVPVLIPMELFTALREGATEMAGDEIGLESADKSAGISFSKSGYSAWVPYPEYNLSLQASSIAYAAKNDSSSDFTGIKPDYYSGLTGNTLTFGYAGADYLLLFECRVGPLCLRRPDQYRAESCQPFHYPAVLHSCDRVRGDREELNVHVN